MTSKDDVQRLILNYQRRLQKLKEKETQYGIETPVHILTEIEDITIQLEALQALLATLSSGFSGKSQRSPHIFLCHANEDKPQVAKLYHKLKEAGYHPWLDKYDLIPGQDWRREIKKLITHPYNLVVICLSHKSITKRAMVQRKIKWALDVLDQVPEDIIYLIPARLEPCEVPDRLSSLHWVDLFEPDGFDNLKRALDFEIGKR